MPTPDGEITTSQILNAQPQEEVEDDLQPLPDSSGVQPQEKD
jgi:hypothetical protein